MKILITGGLGFIFSHVAEYFAQKHQVTILDNLSDGSHPELIDAFEDQGIKIIQKNVNQINKLTKPYDVVIHAAAESNVDKSIRNQQIFVNSNVLGTIAVLDWIRLQKLNNTICPRLLYINTDEVYGSTEHWCEPHQATNPSNPYAASKAAAGSFCWSYHKTYGIPVQEVRLCNVIGLRQATTKLLPRVIERMQNNLLIPIYDGGSHTREYMDARDVAPLLEIVLENKSQKIFNLTFNQELSISEVVATIEAILGKKANIVNSTRPGHDKRYRMVPDDLIVNQKYHNIQSTIQWILGR